MAKVVQLIVNGTPDQIDRLVSSAKNQLEVEISVELGSGGNAVLSFPISPNKIGPVAAIAREQGVTLLERRIPF